MTLTQGTETGVAFMEQRVPLGWKCLAAVTFSSDTPLGRPKIAGPRTSMCPGSGVSGRLPARESEPAFFRGQATREGRDKGNSWAGVE